MPRVVEAALELFAATELMRARGERVGLVPTMGALHVGHMSLVEAVRAAGAKRVVVSIFVNPLQFGANEDLTKYPRTFEADLALCEQHGVDLVYAPNAARMYPPGFETHVEVTGVTRHLEGSARPGHFRGVTTVVTKLFAATGACVAAFGRKDYQQWRVIERMTRDLDLPVEVLGCPILRDSDGVALSSRNRYLNDAERARARSLSRALQAASRAFADGEREVAALLQHARAVLEPACDSIDYTSVADADDLSPCEDRARPACVLLIAARIGSTRLIDNARLGEECLDLS
jgi:pantoate--beta-alanine ligase